MKKFILLFGAVVFACIANAKNWEVHVVNMTFSPQNITINPGDSVTWIFDEANHTTTSGSECTKDNIWDSGTKGTGTSFTVPFSSTLKTYSYFCKNHCPTMEGTVTVSDISGMQEGALSAQKNGLQNYPNPFTGTTSFSFYAEKSGKGVLDIYTVEGKKMTSLNITAVSGQNTIPVSLDLAKGTYVARLSLDATLPEYKLIVKQQ